MVCWYFDIICVFDIKKEKSLQNVILNQFYFEIHMMSTCLND